MGAAETLRPLRGLSLRSLREPKSNKNGSRKERKKREGRHENRKSERYYDSRDKACSCPQYWQSKPERGEILN